MRGRGLTLTILEIMMIVGLFTTLCVSVCVRMHAYVVVVVAVVVVVVMVNGGDK